MNLNDTKLAVPVHKEVEAVTEKAKRWKINSPFKSFKSAKVDDS